jgi:hypothetical protein
MSRSALAGLRERLRDVDDMARVGDGAQPASGGSVNGVVPGKSAARVETRPGA